MKHQFLHKSKFLLKKIVINTNFLRDSFFLLFFCKPKLLYSLCRVHRLKQRSLMVNSTHWKMQFCIQSHGLWPDFISIKFVSKFVHPHWPWAHTEMQNVPFKKMETLFWSKDDQEMVQVSQWVCGVFFLRNTRKKQLHSGLQPALGDPAGAEGWSRDLQRSLPNSAALWLCESSQTWEIINPQCSSFSN